MVRRSTWILVVIFVAMVGLAWYFERYQANKAENTATATPTVAALNLYDLANGQVTGINLADSAGNKLALYLDPASSKWAITDIPAEQADSFQIESISKQLTSLQVEETMTNTLALDSVGLSTPAYTITMTTSDGTQLVTYIGSATAIGSGYYARVDEGPVVIVNKVAMDDILNLLTKPPLLPTATPEVTPSGTASPTEVGGQATPTPTP